MQAFFPRSSQTFCDADGERDLCEPGREVTPLSSDLSRWASRLDFHDLPSDVVESTKLRVLDVIGLSLAGAETPFGRATRAAGCAMSPPGPSRVLGTGDRVGVTTAAFVNGAFSQALEFDDTHNE